MKKEIKKLQEQISAQEQQRVGIGEKIQRLKSKMYQLEVDPKMQAMIGKCFKCRNSYGANQKDWWLYSKVIDYEPQNKLLVVCTYQRTSMDNINIWIKRPIFSISPLDYRLFEVPITTKQFDVCLNRAIEELEKMKEL
ncbi:hypothetical protein LCGC14_0376290 [marine sediment metagenome]|uniref:Uncharacterized protein n=1 Tax=marine sediment metagenome TaxID=412755 RepID=A0A0F9VR32_9ZZZZ